MFLLKKLKKYIRRKDKHKMPADNFSNLNFHINIKPGDMVRLNKHAREKQKRNDIMYGKCNIPNCTCKKMFNREFVGFVIGVKNRVAEVRWPDNIIIDISTDDIDKISED